MNFMYKNTLYLLLLISLISCSSSGEDINYPESKKISFKENLHGYEITAVSYTHLTLPTIDRV